MQFNRVRGQLCQGVRRHSWAKKGCSCNSKASSTNRQHRDTQHRYHHYYHHQRWSGLHRLAVWTGPVSKTGILRSLLWRMPQASHRLVHSMSQVVGRGAGQGTLTTTFLEESSDNPNSHTCSHLYQPRNKLSPWGRHTSMTFTISGT